MAQIKSIVGATTQTEPKISFDGKSLFFLEDTDGRKQVFQKDLSNNKKPRRAPNVDEDIRGLFISPHSHHISIMLSGGEEEYQIRYCTFDENQFGGWIPVDPDLPKGSKQNFGSWRPDGIHYLQLVKDSDQWDLRFHEFATTSSSILQDVGYYAKMIGYVGDEPLTFEEHAKFDCTLNWTGDFRQGTTQSRLEEYGSTSSDGGLVTIRGKCTSDFSEVVEFRSEGDVLQTQVIKWISEEIESIIPYDDSDIAPRGELLDITADNEDFILNFNIDGECSIFHCRKKNQQLNELKLDSIREKTGSFWVDSMHLRNGQLVMEISSFSTPPHIWHFDLQTKKLQQLTTPSPSSIKIGDVTPEVHPSTGQQYLVIEPDSGISGTVIFFHGGPAVPMRRRWNPIIASFLVNGFRVITPNPRGSLGRGPRFAGLDDGHLRLNLIEKDIAPFLESMKKRYENLFMYGGSYGGWLVLKIATSPCGSMIRAGATRNGIGDFKYFYDKQKPWRRNHRHREYVGSLEVSDSYRNEILDSLSPMNSQSVFCPNIYLFSGLKDKRVDYRTSKRFTEKFESSEGCIRHFVFGRDEGTIAEGHGIKRPENLERLIKETISFFRENSELSN